MSETKQSTSSILDDSPNVKAGTVKHFHPNGALAVGALNNKEIICSPLITIRTGLNGNYSDFGTTEFASHRIGQSLLFDSLFKRSKKHDILPNSLNLTKNSIRQFKKGTHCSSNGEMGVSPLGAQLPRGHLLIPSGVIADNVNLAMEVGHV